MQTLKDLLAHHNIDAEITWTGVINRNDRDQWFVGHKFAIGDKIMYKAYFGDWHVSGGSYSWQSDSEGLTPEELKDFKTQSKMKELADKSNQEGRQKVRALELEAEYTAIDNENRDTQSTYLHKKSLSRTQDTKLQEDYLLIPLRDTHGKLWNFQSIGPSGNKVFQKEAKVQGLFHTIQGNIVNAKSIYVVEGYATGASVAVALPNETIVAAMSSGNLLQTCKELRKVSEANIIVLADNDAHKKTNIGVEAATIAASHVGGHVIIPQFATPTEGHTDWNDLHQAEGIQSVLEQLSKPLPLRVPQAHTDTAKKPDKQSQAKVTRTLMLMRGQFMAKRDGNYFEYRKTHWVEMNKDDFDFLKQDIDRITGGTLEIYKIEGHLSHFLTNVAVVPRDINLFTPNPYRANFQDGTLHLIPNGKTYTIERHSHNQLDYCTSVLPFKIPLGFDAEGFKRGDAQSVTPQFDEFLARVFADRQDAKEKIRAIQQAMGGCLVSLFPRWVHFDGHSGSGKSTILKIMSKLVHQDDIVITSMHGIENFMLSKIIGKSVLMDNDIDTKKALKSDVIKKAIDGLPVVVDRKFKDPMPGKFPAMIITAGNGLPVTADGDSKAFYRRMTIIKVDSWTAVVEDLGFVDRLWNDESDGIVAWALGGLVDLLACGGAYLKLESSHDLVGEMQDRGDIIAQFVEDINHGLVFIEAGSRLEAGKNRRINRTELWEIFKNEQEEIDPTGKTHLPRHEFYSRISKHYPALKSQGVRMQCGIGHVVIPDGVV